MLDSPATSQLVHKPHFDRITKFIEQARADGHYIVGGESDAETRKVGLTCVKVYAEKESTGGLFTEEIFGPILPIISVKVSVIRAKVVPFEAGLIVRLVVSCRAGRRRCHRTCQCQAEPAGAVRILGQA